MANWLQLTYENKNKTVEEAADEEDMSTAVTAVLDNWLQESSPMLADIPADQLSPNIAKESYIQLCATEVKFTQTDGDFYVKKQGELIQVLTGDVIETEDYLLRIQVNKEMKPRQADTAIFGMQEESLALNMAQDVYVETNQVADAGLNHLLPQVTCERDTMNPLAFLGDSAKQPVDSWASSSLLVGMDGILDPSCDDSHALPNSSQCLQAAFDGSVYKKPVKDVHASESNSVVPFKNASQVSSESSNCMMYADMQPKKPQFSVNNESPLDEIDHVLAGNYEIAVGQNTYVKQELSKSLRDSYDDEGMGRTREDRAPWMLKLKRKLWD